MKQNCIIVLFLTVLFLSCDNDKTKQSRSNNDSIEKYLGLAGYDTLSLKEKEKWNYKAFTLIDVKRNDTLTRWYLCQVAYNFSRIKEGEKYIQISGIHFKKAIESKDTLNLARYYRFRGGYYRWNGRYDSALYYYNKAEKFYIKTKYFKEIAKFYFSKSSLQLDIDDYVGAELSANQVYNLIKNEEESKLSYEVLNILGNIAHNLKHYDQAIKFHKKTLKLATEADLSPEKYKLNFLNTSLNNIGNSLKEQKKYEEAINYFERAIADKKDFKYDPLIFAFLYTNLGYCKLQLKDYRGLPKLFTKSIKIYDSLGVKNECAVSHIYLSDYYSRTKDTSKAITHSEKALLLAKEAQAPYYYLIALSQAGAVNKEKAPQYIKDYHRINDSLQFKQRKARSQFYKIQLETDEIASEKEKAVKEKWLMISVISGVLLIVILLFIIYRQRTRQKQLALEQIQQEANEEIYQLMLNEEIKIEEARKLEKNRIALELHDGVMNKLVSTRMNLFVLSRKNDPQTIANCLNYIEDIREVENEIENLSHNLQGEVFLEKRSFAILLEQLAESQNKGSGTAYKLNMDKTINWETVANETKMHLYRIIQEAINNINKHALAKNADISFSINQNEVRISVADNGVGFDTEKTKGGIGLKNMQQRAASIKGRFDIESDPSKGTVLLISFTI